MFLAAAGPASPPLARPLDPRGPQRARAPFLVASTRPVAIFKLARVLVAGIRTESVQAPARHLSLPLPPYYPYMLYSLCVRKEGFAACSSNGFGWALRAGISSHRAISPGRPACYILLVAASAASAAGAAAAAARAGAAEQLVLGAAASLEKA